MMVNPGLPSGGTDLVNRGKRNFFGTWVAISISCTLSSARNECRVADETRHTYEVQRCMNGGNSLQRRVHLGAYTTLELAGIAETGLVGNAQRHGSTQWE
jgi:hypothetical protein